MFNFGRLITAMITPMHEDGRVNYEGAAQLAMHLVNNGSDGIVVAGTTGESPTLTEKEKLELFRVVAETVGSRATVLAGTCSYNTKESVELTKAAEKTGVDGILAVVPYYNKPPQEGLYQHFKTIAESTSLPIMLYNIPGRTGINMKPETVARLAEIKNIIALKEAAGDVEQTAQMVKNTPKDFLVYSGDDVLTLPFMSVGAYGVVSVAAHLVGNDIKKMIQSFIQGKVEEALEIHNYLTALFKILFITSNPIPVKYALQLVRLPAGPTRLPLYGPSDAEKEAIKETMKKYNLL